MKKPKMLADLFHETLKNIYSLRTRSLKPPKMARAAQSKELKAAFAKHERETRGQVKRLQSVFKILGKPARGKTCAAINGITEESAEIMKDLKGMRALMRVLSLQLRPSNIMRYSDTAHCAHGH